MPESPADTIRRGAALMRGRAQAAARGPWHVEPLGAKGYPQRVSNAQAIVIAQTYTSPVVSPVHAQYIATLHPGVALLIADSWEKAAAVMDETESVRVAPLVDHLGEDCPTVISGAGWRHHDWTATLAAARALLGEVPDA